MSGRGVGFRVIFRAGHVMDFQVSFLLQSRSRTLLSTCFIRKWVSDSGLKEHNFVQKSQALVVDYVAFSHQSRANLLDPISFF